MCNLYQIGSGFHSLIKVCEYLVPTQNGHATASATQPNSKRKKFDKRVAPVGGFGVPIGFGVPNSSPRG